MSFIFRTKKVDAFKKPTVSLKTLEVVQNLFKI